MKVALGMKVQSMRLHWRLLDTCPATTLSNAGGLHVLILPLSWETTLILLTLNPTSVTLGMNVCHLQQARAPRWPSDLDLVVLFSSPSSCSRRPFQCRFMPQPPLPFILTCVLPRRVACNFCYYATATLFGSSFAGYFSSVPNQDRSCHGNRVYVFVNTFDLVL